MRLSALLAATLLASAAACGTASTSQVCDEATPCPDGETCDLTTGQCEPATDACADSTDCDAGAPYCIVGTDDVTVCSATCDADPVCAEVDSTHPFCEADACRACSPDDNAGCAPTSGAPICDAESYACRGCVDHAECPSQACMPDGTCAPLDGVVYASPTGVGDCLTPATACDVTSAFAAAGADRRVIRLLPGTHVPTSPEPITLSGLFTVLGGPEPTALIRTEGVDGPVVQVVGPATVQFDQVSLRGGVGVGPGDALTCADATLAFTRGTISEAGSAAIASSNCALTVRDAELVDNPSVGIAASGNAPLFVERSTIARNQAGITFAGPTSLQDVVVADQVGTGVSSVFTGASLTVARSRFEGNGGRAIYLRGDLTLTGSTIAHNDEGVITAEATASIQINNNFFYGNGTASTNVGALSLRGQAGSMLEFNTIVANHVRPDYPQGAAALVSFITGLAAPNNIIIGNDPNQDGLQIVGAADTSASYVGASLAGDPLAFADVDGEDYHLTAISTLAIGHAVPSTVTTDIDGQPRDLQPDLGADEYVAP